MMAVHTVSRNIIVPNDGHLQTAAFGVAGVDQMNKPIGLTHDQKLSVALREAYIWAVSPLLNSMRVGGQYFVWPFGKAGADTYLMKNETALLTNKLSAIYAIALLALLWVNTCRMILIFTVGESDLPSIVQKMVFVIWHFQCTIHQTAYFFACRSGKLMKLLSNLNSLESVVPSSRFRGLAVKFTVATWMINIVSYAFFAYITAVGLFDLALVPFLNDLAVSSISAIRIVYAVFLFIPEHANNFTTALSLMVSVILAFQFRHLDIRLHRMIDSDDSIPIDDVELEKIRRQHHTLCRLVERTDHFMMIHNIGAFLCPLSMIVCYLYVFVLGHYTEVNDSTFGSFVIAFWMCKCVCQLSLTAAGGVLVNYYAHKIQERIHGISLSSTNMETIGKVNVFLSRTSGEPIGFTVFGVMVIDKTSIISVLSLIITYFMLIVQLTNPSSSGGNTSVQSNFSSAVFNTTINN